MGTNNRLEKHPSEGDTHTLQRHTLRARHPPPFRHPPPRTPRLSTCPQAVTLSMPFRVTASDALALSESRLSATIDETPFVPALNLLHSPSHVPPLPSVTSRHRRLSPLPCDTSRRCRGSRPAAAVGHVAGLLLGWRGDLARGAALELDGVVAVGVPQPPQHLTNPANAPAATKTVSRRWRAHAYAKTGLPEHLSRQASLSTSTPARHVKGAPAQRGAARPSSVCAPKLEAASQGGGGGVSAWSCRASLPLLYARGRDCLAA